MPESSQYGTLTVRNAQHPAMIRTGTASSAARTIFLRGKDMTGLYHIRPIRETHYRPFTNGPGFGIILAKGEEVTE